MAAANGTMRRSCFQTKARTSAGLKPSSSGSKCLPCVLIGSRYKTVGFWNWLTAYCAFISSPTSASYFESIVFLRAYENQDGRYWSSFKKSKKVYSKLARFLELGRAWVSSWWSGEIVVPSEGQKLPNPALTRADRASSPHNKEIFWTMAAAT